MEVLELQKYEAVGNDFLVFTDKWGDAPFDADLARALCDRNRGVGADGLLRLFYDIATDEIVMDIRNADGSIAETSGNGLRCAALAAVHNCLGGDRNSGPVDLLMRADSVVSHARVVRSCENGSAEIEVEMGNVSLSKEIESVIEGARSFHATVGNPHLVFVGENFDDIDIESRGRDLESGVPGGQNVEFISPRPLSGELDLLVWERGAGRTLSCGTGSCAGAAAARLVGLVGDSSVVHNPGGALRVTLDGDLFCPTATLAGPARRIAEVRVDTRDLFAEGAA